MDRFIVQDGTALLMLKFYLKSNMDRFIVFPSKDLIKNKII